MKTLGRVSDLVPRRVSVRFEIGRAISPRDFRSFFVQTMVDGGVPMAMASKMVGREDIRTTQAHYYKLSSDRRRVIGEGIPV